MARILIQPDAWRRLWAGLDIDAVKKYLLRAELLIADRKGRVPSLEKISSKAPPARFYVLAPAFVERSVTRYRRYRKGAQYPREQGFDS